MTQTPLMPMATAVWLVENTTLTFKQIADFCKLHEVEVQGIADGEVAKGIKAYNPITSGQLTKEEIELSSKDQDRALKITSADVEITSDEKKIKKYVPLSVSYTHLRAHETLRYLVCRLLLEKKNSPKLSYYQSRNDRWISI